MPLCKNCREEVTLKYCPNCGQNISVTTITIPQLLRDLPHAIFHVDKGFLYNLIQLLKRPGAAICDFLEGKRKPFFHPASYLVIALVLNYLVVKITNLHFFDNEELLHMDPLEATAIKDYDAMQWWFLEHTYIYILLAIPASSVFLYLLFRGMKQSYNMAEAAIAVLFIIAQGVLIQSTLYLLFGWTGNGSANRALESVNMTILVAYASLVIFQLFTPGMIKWKRIIMGILGGAGLAAVWIASAFLLYYLLS